MRLTELIKLFRDAREIAAPQKWESIEPSFNYFPRQAASIKINASLENEDDFSCDDERFCILAANHILELTEKAEKMQRALEFYSKAFANDGVWIGGPIYIGKCHGNDMETINSFAIGGKLARQVLEEVEEECPKDRK
jgi:hypothetical protein